MKDWGSSGRVVRSFAVAPVNGRSEDLVSVMKNGRHRVG